MTADVDPAAVRLQLEELQQQWQGLQDSKLALQLFLKQGDSDTSDVVIVDHVDLTEESTEQQLQEQIHSLSGFLTAADDQQVALNSIAAEEAQQAASLQLASALEAREQWEADVLRPHDAALAHAIANCSDSEWEERGDTLENPLDLSDRPTQLTGQDPAECDKAEFPAAAGVGAPPDTSNSCPGNRCLTRAAAAAAAAGGAPSSSSKRPLYDLTRDDHRGGSRQRQEVQCGICFESFPADQMVSASLLPGAASSSRSGGHCGHKYCTACMKQYVGCEVQARKFPVRCPNPSCAEKLSHADGERLLSDQQQLLQAYHVLEAEQLIDQDQRVYCPYKDCSVLLERPEQQDGQSAHSECPVCHRSFCHSCGIEGWHTDMTCQEYQALPPELRSVEDAAMLRIAKDKQWKRCPSCGHLVERTAGCNHMVCRCSCHFCYACGVKYLNADPSANNEQGTPGCSCELFPVPEETADAAGNAPVVLHQWNHLRYHQPMRDGREVSRTRCRHAPSIDDCPYGPERCWFWHDEDEAAAQHYTR